MGPYFGLVDNIMPQMTGNISQMLNISKGDPDTPILDESMIVPYKSDFMQVVTH